MDFVSEDTKDRTNPATGIIKALFRWLHEQFADSDHLPERITVTSLCVKGKHRSVALAVILEYILRRLGFSDVEVLHQAPTVGGWNTLCGKDVATMDIESVDHDAHYDVF